MSIIQTKYQTLVFTASFVLISPFRGINIRYRIDIIYYWPITSEKYALYILCSFVNSVIYSLDIMALRFVFGKAPSKLVSHFNRVSVRKTVCFSIVQLICLDMIACDCCDRS